MIPTIRPPRRHDPVVIAIFAGFAMIVSYLVLFPPQVALANNGDFQRLSLLCGIDYRYNPWTEPAHNIFFSDVEYLFRTVRPQNTGYFSSQAIFVLIARVLNEIVGKQGFFDLRVLGLVNSVSYIGAVALLMHHIRPQSRLARRLACLGLAVVLTDSAIVQFFNSFYSEPAEIIFLILMAASFLAFGQYADIRRKSLCLAGTVGSGVLFSLAKTQDLLALVPTFLIWLYLLHRLGLLQRAGLKGNMRRLAVHAAMFVLVIAVALFSFQFKKAAEDTIVANSFNAFFQDMLVRTDNPEAVMDAFKIEPAFRPQYRDTIGSDLYHSVHWKSDPAFRTHFSSHVSTGKIIRYYATHPLSLLRTSVQRVRAVGINAVYGISYDAPRLDEGLFLWHVNYPKSTPTTDRINHAFTVWSRVFKRAMHPTGSNRINFVFIFGIQALSAGLSLMRWRKKGSHADYFNIMLFLMFLAQYLLCMIGDSARDDIKHFFISNQIIALSLGFLALNAVRMTAEAIAGRARSDRSGSLDGLPA